MSKDLQHRAEELREQIRHHDQLYYQQAKPEISDQEYDALLRELAEMEGAHPELRTADSPTQRIGGKPIEGFVSVRHSVRMMSIDNTYSEEELREFDERIKRNLPGEKFAYTCEPKIDGVSLSLRYEKGVLALGATRGDGTTGDNVTENAKTIRDVPLKLHTEGSRGRGVEGSRKGHEESPNLFGESSSTTSSAREHGAGIPEVFEVRGEAFLSRQQFLAINQQLEDLGQEPFVNPRNTTAGTLKLLDSKLVAFRKLEFIPHGYGDIDGLELETYTQFYEYLKKLGFRINPHFHCCTDIEGVLKYIHEFAAKRASLPYDTDGVVVKIDAIGQRRALGATAKAPRWCIAYKYQPERAETTLARVVFQVGKTGAISPVAEFEPPVFISGTNVYRASLHNYDEIGRKDLRLNDKVLVEKAGEVIPYVVGNVPEKRPANAKVIQRPTECPSCGSTDLEQDGPRVLCINPACPAQLAEKIFFFAGRNQMDIGELGSAIIEVLLKHKLVKSIPDLYRLKAEDLVPLIVSEYAKPAAKRGKKGKAGEAAEGSLLGDSSAAKGTALAEAEEIIQVRVGEKRAGNIMASIEASKTRGLAHLLAGLGILNIGNRTAQLVAQHFGSLEKLRGASFAEILQAPEMGGGILREVEKLRERYPVTEALTVEQIFASEPISHEVMKQLEHTAAVRGKSVLELISDIRRHGVAAKSLYDFLHSKTGQGTLDELVGLGLKTTEETHKVTSGPLVGKTIVITGSLSKDRSQFKNLIESLGGKATDAVSKSTSFVLAGTEPGSKIDKAKKLGVEIIDEQEFMKRIGG